MFEIHAPKTMNVNSLSSMVKLELLIMYCFFIKIKGYVWWNLNHICN